jgi:hypothetical protein
MAKDLFHNTVKTALQKDGWIITDDPYPLTSGNVDMLIDLGAERLLAAEREGQRIAVEVKSFAGTSNISEFHTAHGQYIDYRYALEDVDPNRLLYPIEPMPSFFTLQFIQKVIQRSQLRLLIYDPEQEVITQWL